MDQDFHMDFEWPVATYEMGDWKEGDRPFRLLQMTPPRLRSAVGALAAGDEDMLRRGIVARGKPQLRRPTKFMLDAAVKVLASEQPKLSERSVLAISKVLGMLTATSRPGEFEPMATWLTVADWMRVIFRSEQLFVHHATMPHFQIANLGLFLKPGPRRQPLLAYRPTSLRDALIFHAARKAALGTRINVCASCSAVFLTGGERDGNKKRAGSKYCSVQCKNDFHNARNKAR